MKDLDMKDLRFTWRDATFYVIGAFVIALGVILLLKSNLGVTSWDVLHTAIYNVTPLTFGAALFIVSMLITLFVIFYHKDWRYLFLVIPFLLVGFFLDLFNEVLLRDFTPQGYLRLFSFISGLFILPAGATMLIISRYPAGIYEELMLVLLKIFKTRNIAIVRFFMELTPVSIGVALTAIFHGNIGQLHFGTPITVILVGPLLQIYIKLYRRLTDENQ